jgi:hypothetical protein
MNLQNIITKCYECGVEITLTYILNFFVEPDLGVDLRLEESFAIASATTVFSHKIGDVKQLSALLFEETS